MSSQLLIERMKQKERIEALEDERIDAIIEECEVALHYLSKSKGGYTSEEKLYNYYRRNVNVAKVSYDDFKHAVLANFEDAYFSRYGVVGVVIFNGNWPSYTVSDWERKQYYKDKKRGLFKKPNPANPIIYKFIV